ncbi:MAG TPA: lytic transglycosylase domain-containing protein [Terracidiphilus sp.]|jgi:soluble lytic murein transglycosylase-like protein
MDYRQAISEAARAAGIDPGIALRVAWQESRCNQFRPDGSVVTSPKGALGIMQVMPATAPGVNLADPVANVNAGISELARLRQKYGEWPLAIAAYNWGEGRVREAVQGLRTVPGEVQRYVAGVLGTGQLQTSAGGWLSQAAPQLAKATPGAAIKTPQKHPEMIIAALLAGCLFLIWELR